MIILSLDTSSKASSIAILNKKKLTSKIFLDCGLIHSNVISDMTKKLFEIVNLDINSMDLLAVCVGPGSFTGIRIGLSFMKAISLVTQKPCIGVSALLALSYSIENLNNDEIIYSCIYANKDEIYFNKFDKHGDSYDRFIKFEELQDIAKKEIKKIIFVGDAADFCFKISRDFCKFEPKYYKTEVDAEFVGKAAYDIFSNASAEKPTLKANYLKKTRAENDFNSLKKET